MRNVTLPQTKIPTNHFLQWHRDYLGTSQQAPETVLDLEQTSCFIVNMSSFNLSKSSWKRNLLFVYPVAIFQELPPPNGPISRVAAAFAIFLQCDTAPQACSVCFGKGDLTLKESIGHFPRILQLELRGTDHLSLIYSTINTNLRPVPTDMWFENKKAGQHWESEADVGREQR